MVRFKEEKDVENGTRYLLVASAREVENKADRHTERVGLVSRTHFTQVTVQ